MSVIITLIAIWATVMWAARFLLLETLMNFFLVFVLGFVLIYLFFILAGEFRTLRLEFESLFYMVETLMFLTLPLLAASITTW